MQKLVVGCGRKPEAGAVNLDASPYEGVDVVFDLNWCTPGKDWPLVPNEVKGVKTRMPYVPNPHTVCLPLPFYDGAFDRVDAVDVLEHVDDLVAVFQELLRVTKVGGTLYIRGPACENPEIVWADPTHRRAFAARTFDNFDPLTYDGKNYGHYMGPRTVKMVQVELINKGWEYWMMRRS